MYEKTSVFFIEPVDHNNLTVIVVKLFESLPVDRQDGLGNSLSATFHRRITIRPGSRFPFNGKYEILKGELKKIHTIRCKKERRLRLFSAGNKAARAVNRK